MLFIKTFFKIMARVADNPRQLQTIVSNQFELIYN